MKISDILTWVVGLIATALAIYFFFCKYKDVTPGQVHGDPKYSGSPSAAPWSPSCARSSSSCGASTRKRKFTSLSRRTARSDPY